MVVLRSIGASFSLVFATAVALADDTASPPPATSAAPAASEAPPPPNAPIVLSPGVTASPPPKHTTKVDAAPERPTHRSWFGYQILIADIAIVGATAALLRTNDESNHLGIFIGGAALYLASGPLIHLANRSDHVLTSLLVRGVALGAGAVAGALLIAGFAGCTETTPCKLETVDFAAIGAGAGALVGTIYDSSTYAWKITPTVARIPSGAMFNVAVAF